uniref:Sulfotransferase 1C4 n=1 Tax=Lygus hesperus TaxID=30085 RepID=A0A0A9WPB6_LYGHE
MFKHQISPVEKSKNDELLSYFVGEDGFVVIGPKKFCMNENYRDHAEGFFNLEVKKDDVWIVTYPRSGTTWTHEMMWIMTHGMDFEKAKSVWHGDKFLFLEQSILGSKKMKAKFMEDHKNVEEREEMHSRMRGPGYELIKQLETPRCIKTHLPLSLLPPNLLDTAKVVYVARHPKDCAVSNYYHNKGTPVGFEAEFEQYWQLFKDGLLMFGPHTEHVKEAWERRDHPNLFFFFYEDLKKDLPGMTRKMAKFLEKYISDSDVEAMVNHLSFDKMKAIENEFVKKATGPFRGPRYGHFRQGKSGYKEEFKNIGRAVDEWVEKMIKATGIPFPSPDGVQ